MKEKGKQKRKEKNNPFNFFKNITRRWFMILLYTRRTSIKDHKSSRLHFSGISQSCIGELRAPNKMERQKERNSKLEPEMHTSHNLIQAVSLAH